MPVILAHGALGPFDEIVFLGIAVVFLGMMGHELGCAANSWKTTKSTMVTSRLSQKQNILSLNRRQDEIRAHCF